MENSAVAFEGSSVAGGVSDDAHVSRLPRRRELPVSGGSTLSKLMRREIGGLSLSGRRPPRPEATFCPEMFRHFKLKEKFYVHTATEDSPSLIGSIKKIVPANDFIFVLDWYRLCVGFHRNANNLIVPYKKDGRIWHFNNGEKMVDLFYNQINDSIITVCRYWTTRPVYNMRALQLENIRRCDDYSSGMPVFGLWTDNLPIFDSCNNLAVISLYQDEQHFVNNIYETKNYNLVHSITGAIQSIATRPGTMIVAYKIFCNTLPIEVFSTESWIVLKKFSHPMPPCNRLQFVGLCYENLLLKRKGQNIQIIDLWNHRNKTTIENSKREKNGPSLSFDLTANNVLLKLLENGLAVTCNSGREQVTLLEAARNDSNYYTFHMNVTMDKSLAILYSRKFIENPRREMYKRTISGDGAINICSTFNGKSIMEVNSSNNIDLKDATGNDSNNNKPNETRRTAREALTFLTAIFYDEEHHRIYTGDTRGFIYVWTT